MKEKNYIYVKANLKENKFICSGIGLKYFIGLMQKASNILLIKSDYIGNDVFNNFELVEGPEQIKIFVQQNESVPGDLCFVDYQSRALLSSIGKKEISEMLYMAHMFEPYNSPFFPELKNSFAYMSHDNSFFCKIYCKKTEDFVKVFFAKLYEKLPCVKKENDITFSECFLKEILTLLEQGILIDTALWQQTNNGISLPVFHVGEILNIDDIYNFEKKYFDKNNIFYRFVYPNGLT